MRKLHAAAVAYALSAAVAFPAAARTTRQIVGVVRAKGGGPLEGVEVPATGPALQIEATLKSDGAN